MKKKILSLSGIVLVIFGSFLYFQKKKCEYPVFDLTHDGKVVEACFHASSIINHEHKNSVMLEIVSPTAVASGEIFSFENKPELALFACQIIFQSRNKQPTLYDFSAVDPSPNQRAISIRNHALFSTGPGQLQLIDRLFCMTDN